MRIFIIVLFAFLFTHPLLAQKEKYQVQSIPSSLVDYANAVVRENSVEVEVRSLRDVRLRHHSVITVLNQEGNRLARRSVHYNNSVRVRRAEAVIYGANGNEIRKYRRRDFRDFSAIDGGTLYSDARYITVDYVPVSYPYTIELIYELSLSNSHFIPNHNFVSSYQLGVENTSYTLTYNPDQLSIKYKEVAFEGFEIEKKESPGLLKYQAKNIEPLRFEAYSPAFNKIAPKVLIAPQNFFYEGIVGTNKGWEDFGKWFYDNLIEGRDQLSNRTIEAVQNLVSGVEDDIEKAKLVYDYVQRNTRYISVQVGIGGLQPITAAEVDRVKYGDCKGLTNYTKALLDVVGVTSYYTHIQSQEIPYDFHEDFASIEQGNHVILAIPQEEGYTWLECTSQTLPFGFIGAGNDNRNVLVMGPERNEIVKTTAYIDADNLRETTAKISINETGTLKATIKIFNKGLSYSRYEIERYTAEEQHRHYNRYWSKINNIAITNIDFKNNRDSIHFTENISIEANQFGIESGGKMIFSINPFSSIVSIPPRYRERRFPVVIHRGQHYKDEFEYTLPQGFTIENLPTPTVIKTKFGHYITQIEKVDDFTIVYKREYLIKKGQYPSDAYEDFRQFVTRINQQDNSKVVLIKK